MDIHTELQRCRERVRQLEAELVATRIRLAGFDYAAEGMRHQSHPPAERQSV